MRGWMIFVAGHLVLSPGFAQPSPPRIVEEPRSQARVVGQPARFKVLAEGASPLSYQWFFEGNRVPSQVTDTLSIPAVSTNHQGKYWVQVNNTYGEVVSGTAHLTVLIPPRITIQPKSVEVSVGGTAMFGVEAEGTQPLSYQWLRNGVMLPGETNALLVVAGALGNGVQPQDGASYRVVVANAAGAVQSEMAFLRVNVPSRALADDFAEAPLFRESSQVFRSSNRDASRQLGEPMHAGKHGGKSVWLAWMSEQEGIVTFRTRGSHVDTLLGAYVGSRVDELTEIASDEDSGGFFASELSFNVTRNRAYHIAIDGYNGAEGDLLIEWFFEPTPERLPVFVVQPVDRVVKLGADAAFMVQTEPGNLPVRWFFNGRLIENVEGPVLFLRGAKPEQAGLYYAVVMQGERTAISRMAALQFSAVGPNDEVLNVFSRDKLGDIIDRPSGLAAGFSNFDPDMSGGAMAAAAAPPVHGYAGTHLFSTYGAVKEEGEPDHCGVIGGASYWFSYVPPNSGQLFLNTDGSSFDTILAVYTATGPYYSNLVEVACDNNSGLNGLSSSLDFPASARVTYYIVVDGVAGATGLVQLNYKLLLPMIITNPVATNSFSFRVTSTPFLPFTIQRSPDLGVWIHALTTNSATGIFDYLDTNKALMRFYRVMQIP